MEVEHTLYGGRTHFWRSNPLLTTYIWRSNPLFGGRTHLLWRSNSAFDRSFCYMGVRLGRPFLPNHILIFCSGKIKVYVGFVDTKKMQKVKENIYDVIQVTIHEKYVTDINDLSILKVTKGGFTGAQVSSEKALSWTIVQYRN